MHIPGQRVAQEMRSEVASTWYVTANNQTEVALLIKAPTTSIKALYAGCRLRLVFGKLDGYLCTGVCIYDIPEKPVLISGVQLHADERSALREVLARRKMPVFLFNEMDVCLAWADATISDTEASAVLELLGPESKLYAGPFSDEASHALDCFCHTIDSSQALEGTHEIEVVEVSPSLGEWTAGRLSFIGDLEHHSILIDSKEEGEVLEKAVWASLQSVFGNRLHKSPQVRVGSKTRELTDVMGSHEYGTFLIEAKDLSVLQAGYSRLQERRTSGVQKQAAKAIAQLVGASKCVKRGEGIFDAKGTKIEVVRSQPLHCIVLLTELMHDGDWSALEKQLIEAMIETGDFFHLIDLSELIMLLKCSRGKATLLDYNFIERCKRFSETLSVHIRSRPAPTSQDQNDTDE